MQSLRQQTICSQLNPITINDYEQQFKLLLIAIDTTNRIYCYNPNIMYKIYEKFLLEIPKQNLSFLGFFLYVLGVYSAGMTHTSWDMSSLGVSCWLMAASEAWSTSRMQLLRTSMASSHSL